jgi:Xaa-Pro aminopeptidase
MKSKIVLHRRQLPHRLKKLQEELKRLQQEMLLIEEPLYIFYLTGMQLSAGKLLVSPTKAHLLVDGRYIEACKSAPVPVALYKEKEFPQAPISFIEELTSYSRFKQLRKLLKNSKLIPLKDPLVPLIAVKDAGELKKIKKSISLLGEGFQEIKKHLKEGITEKELALCFTLFCLKREAQLAFDPIIAFGPHSSMPHHIPSTKKLARGDIVLIDIGVSWNHYSSDMTRTLFFGPPNPLMKEVYSVVEEAKNRAIALCRKGTKLGKLDEEARSVMASYSYEKFFLHSLGHGIGLKTHEYPRIKVDGENRNDLLLPGMIITIEPGIYLPKKGGVRIEEMVLITEKEPRILTAHL